MEKFIKIEGARENNLKDVNLDIPINKISCIIGPSGSGKSTLAFHTLYAESKRRFLNSFPTYLKFFSDRPAPIKVDNITPVLPVFGLPQNNPIVGTRTNVADIMQITDIMSGVFSNFSVEKCPIHHEELVELKSASFFKKENPKILADDIVHFFCSKEDFIEKLENQPLPSRSIKSKRSKKILEFDKDHEYWELFRIRGKSIDKLDDKLAEYLSRQIDLNYLILSGDFSSSLKGFNFNSIRICPHCDYQEHQVTKYNFNPYNPIGACSKCNGFGATLEVDETKLIDVNKSIDNGGVKILEGKRFPGFIDDFVKDAKKLKISLKEPIKKLGPEFWQLFREGGPNFYGLNKTIKYLERKKYKANVRIYLRSIQKEEICNSCGGCRLEVPAHNYCITQNFIPYKELMLNRVDMLFEILQKKSNLISMDKKALKSIDKMVRVLSLAVNMGLGHLDLNRKAKTLSAGEYQRLLLLKYLSYEGTGALFVFDEPSLGLSKNEIEQMFAGLKSLIDQGNTILLVEHSKEVQKLSDFIIEMGPGPGHLGGKVICTGKFVDKEKISLKDIKPYKGSGRLLLKGPKLYGKTFNDVEIEYGGFNWVHGASGTGKSACFVNILANELYYRIHGEYLKVERGEFKAIEGKQNFEEILVINSNISQYSSRSSVGSATDLFSIVRRHFLGLSISKSMGLKDGHLSTNSELGQCAKCEGRGFNIIEMQFLEDVVIECEDCHGKGLKEIYANLSDGNMTVYEAYHMPIGQVLERVRLTPKYQKIYEYMKMLNLTYLSLSRSVNSLSGGEKQRIYLLSKLQKKIENSLIILENISFGLSDTELLAMAEFLQSLQSLGNTIVVIDQSQLFSAFASRELKFF